MAISLLEALNTVLLEASTGSQAEFAINNRRVVQLKYDDTIAMSDSERNHKRPRGHNRKGIRTVYPYAYGLTKSGKPVLRAFQINPNSRRGVPKWKFFRLDRVTFWRVTKRTFDFEPKMFLAPNAPDFNTTDDRSMSTVLAIAKLPDMNSPLERERAKMQNANDVMKVGKTQNDSEPIPVSVGMQRKRNVFTSQPNSSKYQQAAKNIEGTNKDNNYWSDYEKAEIEANKGEDEMEKNVPTPHVNDAEPIPNKTTKSADDEEDWDNYAPRNNW